jgi:hypothetical protein
LILFGFTPAFAQEERKTLKELLFEKGLITKDEAASIQEVKIAKWIDRITFGGDLRLRYEYFNNDSPHPDRGRFRYRLRMGTEITIGQFLVGVRLASGTGEQVSTNQSFDNAFSQKQIWFDRAYLQWRPANWIALTGGKMPQPFFWIETTDIVWDGDVNPEGFAENLKFRPTGSVMVFFNAAQFVLDEDGADSNDQWMLGEQIGTELTFSPATKLTLALADYYSTNIDESTLGQVAVQNGNSRGADCGLAAGVLCGPFNVVNASVQLATKVGPLPLTVMGDWIRNTEKTTSGKNFGFQAGAIFGKASEAKTWELAYLYKYSETDATLADFTDSDFGNGGTNRKGHIMWAAYSPTKYLQAKVKFFKTKVVHETLAPFRNDIDRLQVDLSIKF